MATKLEQLKQKIIDEYGYTAGEIKINESQLTVNKTSVYLRPNKNLRIWLDEGFIEFKNVSSVWDYLTTNVFFE